ncbi:hypothetical protein HYH02_006555 [Chlamydomonas schloesseri]|uniref:Uncharacterized protein n=1 Tax=Chlamydomonas schloesseri TaxID=2026947 RepID=A0A835T4Z7_9CHLO|nr:hypothetical protein HYH02_006555 [Chlamydomonas schloesseri]|eukprot:KAG2439027.1 hypothetical protein HYH02_006555 [Chlamydomonas schloesseri]
MELQRPARCSALRARLRLLTTAALLIFLALTALAAAVHYRWRSAGRTVSKIPTALEESAVGLTRRRAGSSCAGGSTCPRPAVAGGACGGSGGCGGGALLRQREVGALKAAATADTAERTHVPAGAAWQPQQRWWQQLAAGARALGLQRGPQRVRRRRRRRRGLLQYEFFPAGFPVLLNPALDVIDGVGRPGLPPNADRDAAAATASLCQQVGLAAAGTLAQCANLPGGPRPTGGRRLRG